MQNRNINFKDRLGNSSHNFANRLWCASAHREQASADTMCVGANCTRRSLDKSLYSKIAGWSLAALTMLGAFSYLTFIPNQVFAAYDWETRKLKDITTMQDMNAKICENTTEIEVQYSLEDTRDGKKYSVAKLQDGNCWMTQNLAYDGKKKDGTIENIGKSCTLSGLTNGSTCSGWSNSTVVKYFAIGSHTDGNYSSRGNYYNWPAAVAGDTSTTEPKQGICPDGWRLPTSGSGNTNSKSFGGLMDAYSISSGKNQDKLTGDPLYFQYGGDVYDSQLNGVGGGGNYWSSTPNTNFIYDLYFSSVTVDPFNPNGPRGYGHSVRCVAADVYPELNNSSEANVAITVSPVISIDVTKHANDMTVDFTKVATSTIIARVGSNQPYQVLLSTDKSNLTNPNTDKTIPMIPSDQTIVKGINSWGIKKLSSPTDTTVNESTTYSPVGINGNKALFYESTSAASEDLTFPVAIAVDSSLSSGQYYTQVTLTVMSI